MQGCPEPAGSLVCREQPRAEVNGISLKDTPRLEWAPECVPTPWPGTQGRPVGE